MLARDKHSSLLGPFLSNIENEVVRILSPVHNTSLNLAKIVKQIFGFHLISYHFVSFAIKIHPSSLISQLLNAVCHLG